MREHVERDILVNSKYVIAFFSRKGKKITHFMLQKLLYFLEAIYMIAEEEDYLYKEEFYAWNFGPINDVVYSEYKIFGKMPLELYEEEIIIHSINERYIANLYEMFKDYNAYQLVSLSHAPGSPWNLLYKKYGLSIPEDKVIEKEKTRDWFRKIVKDVQDEE